MSNENRIAAGNEFSKAYIKSAASAADTGEEFENDGRHRDREIIYCENLVKIYKTADIEVLALQGLDLTVERGEMMAIIGSSGSGKSTLLNMIGGLDRPSAGVLEVDGKNLLKLSDRDLMKYKRDTVGFVWQNNARNLIPYLTAKENVELPMRMRGTYVRGRAVELLDSVGMAHRRNNKQAELSGGEQRRVAIAVALANNPSLLLADEPTGDVDTSTSDQVMNVFRHLNETTGLTVVIVTHDSRLAKKVNRVVAIRDGKTSSEFLVKKIYRNDLDSFAGAEDETHEEFIVLDRAGRLQLPSAYMETLGLEAKGKVSVSLDQNDEKILISPYREE